MRCCQGRASSSAAASPTRRADRRTSASTPSGRRENNPVWWRLRLATLQLMGRADEFDLAALDYCVTYGVTPPEWAAPGCAWRELEQLPVSAHALRPPVAAPAPMARR